MKPVYEISTWDTERQTFSPQEPEIPHRVEGIAGLRRALRAAKQCAYGGNRHDASLLVERVDYYDRLVDAAKQESER